MAVRMECYYGPPGSGKSDAVATIIEQLHHETGKKARVLIGDGSFATYADAGLIDAGVVEAMDYTIRDWPISTLEQLAEGYWPEDVLDPNSKLVAPTKAILDNICLTSIEGISMAGAYIMGDKKGGLAYRSGRGEKIGQDSPIQITDADLDPAGRALKGSGSGRTYGGNPISHFNVGQMRLTSIIERSKMLPGWVIWTAHEKVAEVKLTGEKIIGPEGVGNAATPTLPRLFNNTLHFVTAEKVIKREDEHTGQQIQMLDTTYRIYVRNHFRPEGKMFVKYLATCRVTHPEMMPKDGYFESSIPGESILKFYDVVAQSRAKALAAIAAGRPAAIAA